MTSASCRGMIPLSQAGAVAAAVPAPVPSPGAAPATQWPGTLGMFPKGTVLPPPWLWPLPMALAPSAAVAGERVRSHKLHFIDLDRALLARAAQSFLNLFCDILGFRSGHRESTHQPGEIFL